MKICEKKLEDITPGDLFIVPHVLLNDPNVNIATVIQVLPQIDRQEYCDIWSLSRSAGVIKLVASKLSTLIVLLDYDSEKRQK